jgi:hypothetical protein
MDLEGHWRSEAGEPVPIACLASGPARPPENRRRELTGALAGRRARPPALASSPMSKKTNKRKIKARRKKANHGRRPNAGR